MYIDDTISTVKSLVGFTDVTDICRPVMYTEFNTLIVEIKNLSMEVNFMDSNDSFGRSINNSVLYREQVAWLSHEIFSHVYRYRIKIG